MGIRRTISGATLIYGLIVQSTAALPASEKVVRVGKETVFRGNVVKVMKLAGKLTKAKCAVFTVYHVFERRRQVCTDWRLGGKCLIPGYAQAVGSSNCPRFCNNPHWEYGGTYKEFAGDVVRDCTAIGLVN